MTDRVNVKGNEAMDSNQSDHPCYVRNRIIMHEDILWRRLVFISRRCCSYDGAELLVDHWKKTKFFLNQLPRISATIADERRLHLWFARGFHPSYNSWTLVIAKWPTNENWAEHDMLRALCNVIKKHLTLHLPLGQVAQLDLEVRVQ